MGPEVAITIVVTILCERFLLPLALAYLNEKARPEKEAERLEIKALKINGQAQKIRRKNPVVK